MSASVIAVAGYASVDYAMRLAPFRGLDATTIVRSRAEVWPRIGGIAHVTSAIAQATNAAVSAISWVGPDDEGVLWRDFVAATGVDVASVAVSGTRSPSSQLLYPEDGGTICLFDPADCHPAALLAVQRRVIEQADWVILTVGPVAVTRMILQAVRPDTRLAWVVKSDAASVPADLRREILQRADIVTMSENERGFVDDQLDQLRPGVLVVETQGARGSRVLEWADGLLVERGTVESTRVSGVDTTGAGDTFTGTLIAGLARRDGDDLLAEAVLTDLLRASEATAEMLRQRKDVSSRTEPS